jgi:hypothetical protein
LREHLTKCGGFWLRHTKKRIGIEVLDLETNITTVYESIRMAALSLGANQVTLGRYIKASKLYQERYKAVKKS